MKTPSVFRRRILYAATLVVLASSILIQPFASIASADNQAGPFISDTLREDVVDRQLLLYMFKCLGGRLSVSPDDLSSGALTASRTEGARGGMFVYETRACNNSAASNGPGEILNRLGITDFVDFFCGLPSVYNTNTGGLGTTVAGGSNKAACKNGVSVPDSYFVSKLGSNLKQDIITAISKKPRGKDAAGSINLAKRYVQFWQTWARGCSEAVLTNPYPTDSDPAASDPSVFKIPVVNQDGKVKFFVADSGNAKIDNKQVYIAEEYESPEYLKPLVPGGSMIPVLGTCGQLAEDMRLTADAYGQYLLHHKGETGGTTTLPDNTTPTDAEPTTCAVDGIGWIVCPVMQFVGRVNDKAFDFLQSFLGIRPALLVNEPGKTGPHPTYAAWSSFRDIANVAFVIAFLVIVYSQLTSAGISNYGIKKMLPRIIIAAILVNISYFLCSLAVDISNIVGSSIYTLLKDSINIGSSISNQGWEEQTSTILAGAATGIFIILLALVIIMAPMTLVAFGMIILILVARQAFVILLIVISPLAFVAYLLPNTESWFKKWWKAFSAVLMVYPVVGAVFGASTLAANILSSTASGTDDSNLMQLIALGVLAVPLFAVPALLKGSLSAAGSVGQKIASLQDRANRRAARDVKDRAGKEWGAMQNSLTRRALNPQGRLGRVLGVRRRATARREARYDEAERRRAAAEETFRSTDGKASTRETRALSDEQTAKLNKQVLQNQVGLAHINNNAALHAASTTSGLDLHNAEETHKNEVESEHMRDPNNHHQYDNLNESRGEKQNAELETKARFEGSQVAFDQSQMKQMFEGQIDIHKGDQQTAFESSGVGQAQAVEKDRVAQEKKVASSAAEAMAIELNQDVRVNAAAAEQSTAAAKAGETALVEELKTEAGAAANPEYAAAAQQLNEADTVLRVQTQRSGAAKRVADVGYAKAIQDETTGLADIAGGVEGLTGVSQAKAVAHQTILDSYRKGVAAESTLMSEVREQDILGDTMLGSNDILDQPDEKIAAMGSVIAKRQHMASHIKLWERMAELKAQTDAEVAAAEASGDPTQIATAKARAEKVSNMQQIVMADKSKKPFGIGDEAQGDATVGQYNKDIYEETRNRILTHMSPETLSTMDPDDLSLIYEMGRNGKLSPDHIKKVQEAYDAWKKNPNISSRLKDKAKVLLDPFEQFENGDAGAFAAGPTSSKFPEVTSMANP